MDILAPMILKGAPIKWKALSKVQKSSLNPRVVPRKYRSFFSNTSRDPDPNSSSIIEIDITSEDNRSDEASQLDTQVFSDTLPSSNAIENNRSHEVISSSSHNGYNLRSLGML